MTTWPTRKQHTTPILDKLTHTVTVIDPANPLFGQTFPLVTTRSPRGADQLVVTLPNGQHRSIPQSATDLEAASDPAATASLTELRQTLPRISAHTLLPLARFIAPRLRPPREVPHARADNPEGGAIQPTTPRPSETTPTLWQQLDPQRQQNLAQRLAELIRRHHQSTTKDADSNGGLGP